MSDFQEIVFSPINSAGGIELPSKRPSGINGWKSLNETQSPYTSAHGAADTSHVPTRNESPHLKGGDSTVYGASFNFVNSIVGAGIIAIPQAIQQCGLLLGIFLLLLVAYLVNRSVLMLIECGIKTQKYDLEALCEHLLGRKGYYVSLAFMFLFGYGAQVAYLVIIGDTVPKAAQLLFPGSIFCNRQATLGMLATLVVLPICLFRDLSTLSWTSMLSILADIVIVLIVLVACMTLHTHQDQHFEASDTGEVNDSMFAGVGTMSFAFVCQHNSFMIFRSLAEPTYTEWTKVAGLSVGFACAICIGFGLIGFFAFYPYVQGDLLNNFPVHDVAIATARLFLAVTMVFTYPMECYVTRHCVCAWMAKYNERQDDSVDSSHSSHSHSHSHSHSALSSAAEKLTSTSGDVVNAILETTDTLINNASNVADTALRTVGLRRPSASSQEIADGVNNVHITSGSPSKRRQQGASTYTNINEAEEDVTIMFMENKVLMLYDVAIDENSPREAPLTSAVKGKNAQSAQREAGKYLKSQDSWSDGTTSGRRSSEAELGSVGDDGGARDLVVVDTAHPTAVSLPVHVLLTLLLWGSTLAIALVFEELGVVSALTGAVAASVLGFVLPATLYIKAHEEEFQRAVASARRLLAESRSCCYCCCPCDGGGVRGAGGARGKTGGSGGISGSATGDADGDANAEVTLHFHSVATDDNEYELGRPGRFSGADPAASGSRSAVVVLCELLSAFRQFYMSFAMIVFGVAALIIGVTTVLVDAAR